MLAWRNARFPTAGEGERGRQVRGCCNANKSDLLERTIGLQVYLMISSISVSLHAMNNQLNYWNKKYSRMLWSNGHKTYDLQKLRRDLAPAFAAKTSGIVCGSNMGHDWLMVAYGYHWSIKKSKKSWEFLYSESETLWNVILKQTVKFFVKHSVYYRSSILFASASGQSFIERDGIQVNCIIYSSSVHLNLQWKQETLLRAMEWSSNTTANDCSC